MDESFLAEIVQQLQPGEQKLSHWFTTFCEKYALSPAFADLLPKDSSNHGALILAMAVPEHVYVGEWMEDGQLHPAADPAAMQQAPQRDAHTDITVVTEIVGRVLASTEMNVEHVSAVAAGVVDVKQPSKEPDYGFTPPQQAEMLKLALKVLHNMAFSSETADQLFSEWQAGRLPSIQHINDMWNKVRLSTVETRLRAEFTRKGEEVSSQVAETPFFASWTPADWWEFRHALESVLRVRIGKNLIAFRTMLQHFAKTWSAPQRSPSATVEVDVPYMDLARQYILGPGRSAFATAFKNQEEISSKFDLLQLGPMFLRQDVDEGDEDVVRVSEIPFGFVLDNWVRRLDTLKLDADDRKALWSHLTGLHARFYNVKESLSLVGARLVKTQWVRRTFERDAVKAWLAEERVVAEHEVKAPVAAKDKDDYGKRILWPTTSDLDVAKQLDVEDPHFPKWWEARGAPKWEFVHKQPATASSPCVSCDESAPRRGGFLYVLSKAAAEAGRGVIVCCQRRRPRSSRQSDSSLQGDGFGEDLGPPGSSIAQSPAQSLLQTVYGNSVREVTKQRKTVFFKRFVFEDLDPVRNFWVFLMRQVWNFAKRQQLVHPDFSVLVRNPAGETSTISAGELLFGESASFSFQAELFAEPFVNGVVVDEGSVENVVVGRRSEMDVFSPQNLAGLKNPTRPSRDASSSNGIGWNDADQIIRAVAAPRVIFHYTTCAAADTIERAGMRYATTAAHGPGIYSTSLVPGSPHTSLLLPLAGAAAQMCVLAFDTDELAKLPVVAGGSSGFDESRKKFQWMVTPSSVTQSTGTQLLVAEKESLDFPTTNWRIVAVRRAPRRQVLAPIANGPRDSTVRPATERASSFLHVSRGGPSTREQSVGRDPGSATTHFAYFQRSAVDPGQYWEGVRSVREPVCPVLERERQGARSQNSEDSEEEQGPATPFLATNYKYGPTDVVLGLGPSAPDNLYTVGTVEDVRKWLEERSSQELEIDDSPENMLKKSQGAVSGQDALRLVFVRKLAESGTWFPFDAERCVKGEAVLISDLPFFGDAQVGRVGGAFSNKEWPSSVSRSVDPHVRCSSAAASSLFMCSTSPIRPSKYSPIRLT